MKLFYEEKSQGQVSKQKIVPACIIFYALLRDGGGWDVDLPLSVHLNIKFGKVGASMSSGYISF